MNIYYEITELKSNPSYKIHTKNTRPVKMPVNNTLGDIIITRQRYPDTLNLLKPDFSFIARRSLCSFSQLSSQISVKRLEANSFRVGAY